MQQKIQPKVSVEPGLEQTPVPIRDVELRPFTEAEYHAFFREYRQDPLMNPEPFVYSEEMVSRSYIYNYQYRDHFALYGIFLRDIPVGSFQLKRMDAETGCCEFGIILQNEKVKNRGIGTAAMQRGEKIARETFGMRWLTGDTTGRNKRMQHLFEKLDFQLTETVEKAYDLGHGQYDARLVYTKQIG